MITQNQLEEYLNSLNLDLRITHYSRWIDQKCTPDVVWSISDFILNYVDNNTSLQEFTIADIWHSDYAKETVAETYSKPKTDETVAENEYDKFFSQPINLLCYAGILKDISPGNRHKYILENREVLEYIAKNDVYSTRFLCLYIEKVLKDSDLFIIFEEFFNNQNKKTFDELKKIFIDFYHTYTPVKKEYEPKRIFTKVINPLAYKRGKCGTCKGRMSKLPIKKSDMMYNSDNFRDVYSDKPKTTTRKVWLEINKDKIHINMGYIKQMMNKSMYELKKNISEYRNNFSELTQFNTSYSDVYPATQIHHIFPKTDYPEIMHYIENLIALTPNQHFCFAHPNNDTHRIDYAAQKNLLLAKTLSIKLNLESDVEEHIYDFDNFLFVLSIGWNDNSILDIEKDDYSQIIQSINSH